MRLLPQELHAGKGSWVNGGFLQPQPGPLFTDRPQSIHQEQMLPSLVSNTRMWNRRIDAGFPSAGLVDNRCARVRLFSALDANLGGCLGVFTACEKPCVIWIFDYCPLDFLCYSGRWPADRTTGSRQPMVTRRRKQEQRHEPLQNMSDKEVEDVAGKTTR